MENISEHFQQQIAEMREVAVEENIAIDEKSLANFISFISEFDVTDNAYLFVIDAGILRCVWDRTVGNDSASIALHFHASGKIHYIFQVFKGTTLIARDFGDAQHGEVLVVVGESGMSWVWE